VVQNRRERVIRVCAHCGCEEVCWAQPPARARLGSGGPSPEDNPAATKLQNAGEQA
jgi:hypothetical protein